LCSLIDEAYHISTTAARIVLLYSMQELLPAHPQLASQLMSRYVAIQVLEEQLGFLDSSEAAGLIRGEEVNEVQRKANHRLELLQHARHWHLPPKAAPSNASKSITAPGRDKPAAAGATAVGGAAGGGSAAESGARDGMTAKSGVSVADLNYTSHLRSLASVSRRRSRLY
jgi:hypothetical protein